MRCHLLELPSELLEIICKDLDTLTQIYLRATCKDLALIAKIPMTDVFTLYDCDSILVMNSINMFVDHIYERLVDGEGDRITYYITHNLNKYATFLKKRVQNKYNYSVEIEEGFETRIRVFYDARSKCYKFYKFNNTSVEIPTLLFVICMRFLIKIYRQRNIDYNFDDDCIPAIAKKMLNNSYNGALVTEVLETNLTIV